jgi:hypothetical protein
MYAAACDAATYAGSTRCASESARKEIVGATYPCTSEPPALLLEELLDAILSKSGFCWRLRFKLPIHGNRSEPIPAVGTSYVCIYTGRQDRQVTVYVEYVEYAT